MYEKFYGFNERPFSLLPDPDFLFLSDKHRAGLDMLEMAVFNQTGFCVVSGDIGAGKTTLIRELLNRLDDSICTGLVSNTHASFGVLMQWIMAAYGLRCDTDDRVEMHRQFLDFVIQQYADGKHTLLIIDEAQNLSLDAMEELRMLSNVNSEKDLVLQVILVGQAELRDKLLEPELRQFVQRIAINYHLTGLSREETAAYIRHRISHAGGSPQLFDDAACDAVYHFTDGIPRLINRICDLSLVYGYSEASATISAALVAAVARERWPGEFPEFSEEARTAPAQEYFPQTPVVPAEQPLRTAADGAADSGLAVDVTPVRDRAVEPSAADIDPLPPAQALSEPAEEFVDWPDATAPDGGIPPAEELPRPGGTGGGFPVAWLMLIIVTIGAGLLWINQDTWLASPGSIAPAAPGNTDAAVEQVQLEEPRKQAIQPQEDHAQQQREAERALAVLREAARVEQRRLEQEQQRLAEHKLQAEQERQRLAEQKLQAEQEQQRLAEQKAQAEREQQKRAEQAQLEQRELERQREQDRLVQQQREASEQLARQRAAARLELDRKLAKQRETERMAHEQELAKQREAERKQQAMAKKKAAEQRRRRQRAIERQRAEEERRLQVERWNQALEEEERRTAARAALRQMSREPSWADEDDE